MWLATLFEELDSSGLGVHELVADHVFQCKILDHEAAVTDSSVLLCAQSLGRNTYDQGEFGVAGLSSLKHLLIHQGVRVLLHDLKYGAYWYLPMVVRSEAALTLARASRFHSSGMYQGFREYLGCAW